MPLYGHELSETTDPFTAGVSFGVKLDAGNFIGRDVLRELKPRANQLKRVGLELAGKRIAREGAVVKQSVSQVGNTPRLAHSRPRYKVDCDGLSAPRTRYA